MLNLIIAVRFGVSGFESGTTLTDQGKDVNIQLTTAHPTTVEVFNETLMLQRVPWTESLWP